MNLQSHSQVVEAVQFNQEDLEVAQSQVKEALKFRVAWAASSNQPKHRPRKTKRPKTRPKSAATVTAWEGCKLM